MSNFSGIVPSLEILRKVVDELNEEIFPLINNDEMENEIISNKIKVIKEKVEAIQTEVGKSYDLIKVVIDSIHSSRSELKKSVDGLLKKTGAQLQKVTSTTEEATNKIMDVAERLDEEQMIILDLLDKVEKEKKNEFIDEIRNKIHENQDAAFTIIDFLQFQDITAQQIAGAYSLLSDTEKTLLYVASLLNEVDEGSGAKDEYSNIIDKNSFNSDAKFVDKKNIQSAIDNLFTTRDTSIEIPEEKEEDLKPIVHSVGSANNESADVDIDALFAGKDDSKKEDIDIDALFAGKDDSKKEDIDIDALFAKK